MQQTTRTERYLALVCGALPGLFLLITSTTHLVEGEFVYDVKRLLQLSLMLVLFSAAVLTPALRNAFLAQASRIPGWVLALLGLIIALGVVSSMVNATSGMHLAYSLLEVAMLTLLVVAALVIAACRMVAGETFDQVVITLLAMTAIAVGFQELLGVAAALANDLEFFFRISLMNYSWPRFYNQVQAWTLPVLAALPLIWSRSDSDLMRSRWIQAIVCLVALALNWYVILMTGGRGVALSFAAAFVVCLVLLPAIRRPCLSWHLPGLILGALLFLGVAQLADSTRSDTRWQSSTQPQESKTPEGVNPRDHFEKRDEQSRFARQSMAGRISLDSSGRRGLWRHSLRDIKQHPFLGIGPMNYACTGPLHRAGHPHNFLLQFAGEWGLPATLGLLTAVAVLATSLLRTLRSQANFAVCGLVATGVISAGMYSQLSGLLIMPASQVAGVLAGGWLIGGILLPTSNYVRAHSLRRLSVLTVTTLLCAVIALFAFTEAAQREHRESALPERDQKIPRFWQQGKVCKYFGEY